MKVCPVPQLHNLNHPLSQNTLVLLLESKAKDKRTTTVLFAVCTAACSLEKKAKKKTEEKLKKKLSEEIEKFAADTTKLSAWLNRVSPE